MTINIYNEPALRSYLETALWSSIDYREGQDEKPLDDNYDSDVDFSDEAMASALTEINTFLKQAKPFIAGHELRQVAHDFWLTRNRHGAGFWDGDYEHGEALTKIAHSFGEISCYVGDDNKIHFEG